MTNLQNELTDKRASLSRLESELVGLTNDLQDTKAADRRARIDGASGKKITDLASKVSGLERDIAGHTAAIDELRAEIEDLERRVSAEAAREQRPVLARQLRERAAIAEVELAAALGNVRDLIVRMAPAVEDREAAWLVVRDHLQRLRFQEAHPASVVRKTPIEEYSARLYRRAAQLDAIDDQSAPAKHATPIADTTVYATAKFAFCPHGSVETTVPAGTLMRLPARMAEAGEQSAVLKIVAKRDPEWTRVEMLRDTQVVEEGETKVLPVGYVDIVRSALASEWFSRGIAKPSEQLQAKELASLRTQYPEIKDTWGEPVAHLGAFSDYSALGAPAEEVAA